VLVFIVTLMSLPVCPVWLSDNLDVVAPPGVEVDNTQKIKNKLRCYNTIVKEWYRECAVSRRNDCKRIVNEWLSQNFTVLPTLAQNCPNHQRKTFMLNIRTGP